MTVSDLNPSRMGALPPDKQAFSPKAPRCHNHRNYHNEYIEKYIPIHMRFGERGMVIEKHAARGDEDAMQRYPKSVVPGKLRKLIASF
jgi:hypothetical protein